MERWEFDLGMDETSEEGSAVDINTLLVRFHTAKRTHNQLATLLEYPSSDMLSVCG